MPEGQFLGRKDSYLYVSDDNKSYIIRRDVTLATIDGTDLVVATVQNSGDGQNAPKRFQPRGVHWQATAAPVGARKFLICGSRQAALYVASASQPVTIDGVAGVTTGRRGETYSYPGLTNAPEPVA